MNGRLPEQSEVLKCMKGHTKHKALRLHHSVIRPVPFGSCIFTLICLFQISMDLRRMATIIGGVSASASASASCWAADVALPHLISCSRTLKLLTRESNLLIGG